MQNALNSRRPLQPAIFTLGDTQNFLHRQQVRLKRTNIDIPAYAGHCRWTCAHRDAVAAALLYRAAGGTSLLFHSLIITTCPCLHLSFAASGQL